MFILHYFYENSQSWANSYVKTFQDVEELERRLIDNLLSDMGFQLDNETRGFIKKEITNWERKVFDFFGEQLEFQPHMDWTFTIRTNEKENKYSRWVYNTRDDENIESSL